MELAEGTSKRSRSCGGSGRSSAGGPDRLSALPDCLLHIIMSSLKARQAVQTCVLSTRWRHLWRSVPCLNIDIVEFRTKVVAVVSDDDSTDSDSDKDKDSESTNNQHDKGNTAAHASCNGSGGSDTEDDSSDYDNEYESEYSQGKANGWEEFEDFAVNLMQRCNIALLDSFRLDIDRGKRPRFSSWSNSASCCRWAYSGQQAAAWLRRAMKYCTPGSGHAIISREGLNLSPSSWGLRRLHLCHVPLDDRFAEHLSSVCRSLVDMELYHCTCEIRSITSDSLKNLVLKRCTLGGVLTNIASPTLKTLVIIGGSNHYPNPLLAILAPVVAYLRLDVDVYNFCGGISINKMTSLDRASVHLRGHRYSRLCRDQSELLCSVSNATNLELFGVWTTAVLYEEPKFQNLRNLLLGDCDLSDDFRLLRFFHRGSPNLEKVTLQNCKFPVDSEGKEGKCELNKTGCCCGLDFLRDENVELEIIHKDGHACRSAYELVCDLPNLKGVTDAVLDAAAAAAAAEDSMPR